MAMRMRIIGAGDGNDITDVAGMVFGNADDTRLKSGVTVITAPRPFACGVHVMGGAPGTRELDLLAPSALVGKVDAIVLAGGSAYGLDAASGVMAGLARAGRGFAVGKNTPPVPIVPAAILFDLASGGDTSRLAEANPYAGLGEAALDAALGKKGMGNSKLGSHGAGTGATCADCRGGLGSASLVFDSGAVVAALIAANPFGSVLCRHSRRFWAGADEVGDEFGRLGAPHATQPLHVVTKASAATGEANTAAGEAKAKAAEKTGRPSSTIIGVVATNLALDKSALTRLAVMAHAGIARAVRPSHTPLDGDVLFAVATGEVAKTAGGGMAGDSGAADAIGAADGLTLALLGHAAALCVSRAIAGAAYLASPDEGKGDVLPTVREIIEG